MNRRQLIKKIDLWIVIAAQKNNIKGVAAFEDENLAKEFRVAEFNKHMLDNVETNFEVVRCPLYEEEVKHEKEAQDYQV